ncbi:MAG: DUF882 domain-containing protein [Pseudomonadota bacterium]
MSAIAVIHRARLFAAALAAVVCVAAAGPANAETRSLNLYFIHTKERATITFKKNGRYVPGGLTKLNRFLRDWRQKEATKMDPRLFDLLWEVYQETGSKEHIHVVSAYRSPKTNAMLRKRSRGVAKRSQHTLGKAIDFYIPGVPVKKLRRIGMKFQVGGVGYYPKSGSPFVHLDVGSVRSWPRMNRKELSQVFPDGKTLHLPSDGKPLPGYNQALADYKTRVSADSIQVAGKRPSRATSSGNGLLAGLFRRNRDTDDSAPAAPVRQTQVAAVTAAPRPEPVEATPQLAYIPTPQSRPTPPDSGVAVALAAAEIPQVIPTPASDNPRRPGGLVPDGRSVTLNTPDHSVSTVPLTVATLSNTSAVATTQAWNNETTSTRGARIPVPQLRTETFNQRGTRVALAPTPGNRPTNTAIGALINAPVVASPADTPLMRGELDQTADSNGEDSPKLAYVPRPAGRPDFVSPDGQTLAAIISQDAATAGIPTPTPSPLGLNAAPVRVALAPSTQGLGVDMFSTSTALSRAKGARPSAADAEGDRSGSVRVEPKPNRQMIAKEAVSAGTLLSIDAAFTAPQFVSPYLRNPPQIVHLDGFSTGHTIANTNRFSGRAVNFKTVARFEGIGG